jgi:hypothetical protein
MTKDEQIKLLEEKLQKLQEQAEKLLQDMDRGDMWSYELRRFLEDICSL